MPRTGACHSPFALTAETPTSADSYSASEAQRMRMVRTVAATFAGMMLVPAVAFAQANTQAAAPARDAWYWGINGGAMMFNAGYNSEESVVAPSVGGEWLIMRQ